MVNIIGKCLARVKSHSFVNVGKNETPALRLNFQLVKNLDTGEDLNVQINSDQWLTDNGVTPQYKRTFETLTKAFGWTGTDVFTDFNANGAECILVIEEEEYNGNKFAKVKWINAAGSSAAVSAMQAAEMDNLRRMFQHRMAEPDPWSSPGNPDNSVF